MNFSIYFLLISCLSIIIGETSPLPDDGELERIAGGNQSITGDHINNLKLSEGGKILRKSDTIVWKGTYNGKIDVALKIVSKEKYWQNEMKIFKALGATKDFDIKKHRIPRVYYHGAFLGRYFVIAMTLFEGTLEQRKRKLMYENETFSESTFLLIFKQAVESLSYIHSKNVSHNDINLMNIFIRGNDVFIGDFDLSKLGGNLMKDYNDLMFWLWHMVGLHDMPTYDKLDFFKNKIVCDAFRSILYYSKPIKGNLGILAKYENIIKISADALKEIGRSSGPL